MSGNTSAAVIERINEAAKVTGRDPQAKSEGHRQGVIREARAVTRVGRGS